MRRFVQVLLALTLLACCLPLLTLAEGELPLFFEAVEEEASLTEPEQETQEFFFFVEEEEDAVFETVPEEPSPELSQDSEEETVIEILLPFSSEWGEENMDEAEKEELRIEVAIDSRYAIANQRSFSFSVTAQGGSAPYTAIIRVAANGSVVEEASYGFGEAGLYAFDYMPQTFGTYAVQVLLEDQDGEQAEASAEVAVSVYLYETAEDWAQSVAGVSLSGNWAKDLVRVAKTQLGYRESEYNFIINRNGVRYGYTRYGDWYGSAYSNWCAMFVSFCMYYAEIPAESVPYEASCSAWARKFQKLGVFMAEDYIPCAGDLAFFGDTEHVGIVCKVTDDTVVTIEGNVGQYVSRRAYPLWSGSIIGYASMRALMERAGIE